MKKRHTKEKLTRDILVLIVVIVSIIAFYFGLRFVLATDVPLVVIASGSMSPALEAGDLIAIKGVQPEDVIIGDIIVYDPPREGIGRTVHRVIGIQSTNGNFTFQTKGDANDIEDQYVVYPENIHGRLLFRIPYIGYLFLNPLIPVVIVTIIIIVAILWPEEKKRFRRIHKSQLPKVETI